MGGKARAILHEAKGYRHLALVFFIGTKRGEYSHATLVNFRLLINLSLAKRLSFGSDTRANG